MRMRVLRACPMVVAQNEPVSRGTCTALRTGPRRPAASVRYVMHTRDMPPRVGARRARAIAVRGGLWTTSGRRRTSAPTKVEAHPTQERTGDGRRSRGGPSGWQLGAGECATWHMPTWIMVCAELSRLMFVRPLCLTGQLGSHWQSHWHCGVQECRRVERGRNFHDYEPFVC